MKVISAAMAKTLKASVDPKVVESLMAEVEVKPKDDAVREKAARALDGSGKPKDAVELLLAQLRNLTSHAISPLPCLCKKCLEPETNAVELSGMDFFRDFAVSNGRVLFYWAPQELDGMRQKLANSVG